MIKNIVGSPQQPEPGMSTRKIITFAKKKIDESRMAGIPVTFQPPNDEAPVSRNQDYER